MIERKWFKVRCSKCKKETDMLSSNIDYYLCDKCLQKTIKKNVK